MKKKPTTKAVECCLLLFLILFTFTSTSNSQIMWSQNCRPQDEVGRVPGSSAMHCCEVIMYCRDIAGIVEGHVVQTEKGEIAASMLNLFNAKIDADACDSIVMNIVKGSQCRALHLGKQSCCPRHNTLNGSILPWDDACEDDYIYESIGGEGTLEIYTTSKVAGDVKAQIKNVNVSVNALIGNKVKVTVTGEFCSKEEREHPRCDKSGFIPYGVGWTLQPTTFTGLDATGNARFTPEEEKKIRDEDKKAKGLASNNSKILKTFYALDPAGTGNEYAMLTNEAKKIPAADLKSLLGTIAYQNTVLASEKNRTFYKEKHDNLNRVAFFDGVYFNVPSNVVEMSLIKINEGNWDFNNEWNLYSQKYGSGNNTGIVAEGTAIKRYFANKETQVISGNVMGPSTITVAGGNLNGYVTVKTKDTTAKLPIDKETGHVNIPGTLLKTATAATALIEVFNELGKLIHSKEISYQGGVDLAMPPDGSSLPEIIQTNKWTTIPVRNAGPDAQLVINDQPQATLASSQNELTTLVTAPPGNGTIYVRNPSGQSTPQEVRMFAFDMAAPGTIKKGQTISIPFNYDGMPPNTEIDFTNYSDNIIALPQTKMVVSGKGQGILQVTGKSSGGFSIGYDFRFR